MTTLLADLVRRQTATSLLSVLGRTIDKVVEEMALDLLRDPDTRDHLRELVKAAFDAALTELQAAKPAEDVPADIRMELQRLRHEIEALRKSREEPPA
jgi:hypothetical protein